MERFTKEELEKWWHAQCPKCGWDGLSRDCEGGEPIADTGDFNDPLCPMCIKKDDYVVVDDYAEPDAQATIAALQARVRTATQLIIAEIGASGPEDLEEAVGRIVGRLQQRTAELEAANHSAQTFQTLWRESCNQRDDLQAELERVSLLSSHNERRFEEVDKKYKELRTLILTLPKVEGEIVAQAGYVKDRKKVYACFGSDADMTAYAALLTHRQGMEGVVMPMGDNIREEEQAKVDGLRAVNRMLREQNRVLRKALQAAKYELAALFPIPSAPTVHAALEVCGNNNEADARCIYLAYEAICAALTATSQPQ